MVFPQIECTFTVKLPTPGLSSLSTLRRAESCFFMGPGEGLESPLSLVGLDAVQPMARELPQPSIPKPCQVTEPGL